LPSGKLIITDTDTDMEGNLEQLTLPVPGQ
jgi:hypothetical protein